MVDGEDEEVEELREIADEEAGEEEEASEQDRKSPNKLMIGLLSVLVFFVLFMVFRGGDEPAEKGPAILLTPEEETIIVPEEDITASVLLPKDAVFKDAIIEGVPAGAILIESEDGEIKTIPSAEKKFFPTAEESLPFFESLKEKSEPVKVLPEPKKPSSEPKVSSLKSKKKRPQAKQEVALNSRGKYTIQLGAFKTVRGADHLVERLRKGGYEAYILDEGGTLFRVRVGAYQNRKNAKEVADQIRKSQRLDSFIVSR